MFNSATRYALEQAGWNWAIRAIEANFVPSVEPTFGFMYAFTKPNDWLRTAGVWSDPTERSPLIDYTFEQGYFYANLTPIFIRYVSADPQYGMDLGKWPVTFQRYVEAHIAAEICERLSNNASRHEMLRKLEDVRRREAENKNAMDLPARFPPMGGWARSRLNGFGRSRLNGTGRGL